MPYQPPPPIRPPDAYKGHRWVPPAVSPPRPVTGGRDGVIQGSFIRPPTPQAGTAIQRQGICDLAHAARGSGGARLPEALQRKMEACFKTDFSDVRVHITPQARAIGALVFTIGSHVHFAPGQYQPETAYGRRLLAHELAHVVQQRQGRVQPPGGSNLAIVHDPRLEAEAARLAELAAHHAPASTASRPFAGAVAQLKGSLLTPNQATRLHDNQTYHCEITIDGTNNVSGKNGKQSAASPKTNPAQVEKDHANWYAKIKRIWQGYEPRTDGVKQNNPHAEDDAIHQLLTTKLAALQGPAPYGDRVRVLSVTITAAPCARCARNLVGIAVATKRRLRVKAAQISAEGEEGIAVLREHNVPFRLWTEAQREESPRWRTDDGMSTYSTASFQQNVRDAVARRTRDATRAAKFLARDAVAEDRLDLAKTAWAGYWGAGSKWGSGGGFSRKAAILRALDIDTLVLYVEEQDLFLAGNRDEVEALLVETYKRYAMSPYEDEIEQLKNLIHDTDAGTSAHDFMFSLETIDNNAREQIGYALFRLQHLEI